MVPSFNVDRMVSHAVLDNSKTRETLFQKVASLRMINCFDERIYKPLEIWLYSHKDYVADSIFDSYVPDIKKCQSLYFYPKLKEKNIELTFQSKNRNCGLLKQVDATTLFKNMRGDYSKNILTKLENKGVMTTDGKDWLLQALDPFYDGEHQVSGYPDRCSGKSVVQTVQRRLTLKCPASVTTGTWDAHIMFLPELRDYTTNNSQTGATTSSFPAQTSFSTATRQYSTFAGGTKNYPFRAPFNIVTCPTGNSTAPLSNTWDNTGKEFYGVDLSPYAYNQSRIIAGGFEITNTTPELYRGGSIICYEVQNTTQENINALLIEPSSNKQSTNITSSSPPGLSSAAISIPGATEWDASEGCYMILKQNKQENPPQDDVFKDRIFNYGSNDFVRTTPIPGFGLFGQVITTDLVYQPPQIHPIPFNSCGAYLTGLNAQTTLSFNVRLFVETFPDASDQILVPLMSPSPQYDYVALELYSRVTRELPVACVVSDNASGGWFDDVLKFLGQNAGKIGESLGGIIPGASLIGNGIGAASKAWENHRASQPVTPKTMVQPRPKNKKQQLNGNDNKNKKPKRQKKPRVNKKGQIYEI